MKAAVIHNFGETPRYEDFADPVPVTDEVLIKVKAIVLENVDKMIAAGTHYSSHQFLPAFPAIVGHGGVGELEDGTLVGFGGLKPPYGAMAEKVVVNKAYTGPIPQGISAAVASCLPASTLTSFLPLKHTAKLQPGETVLINGATGVSGKIAVQVAKMLGAGHIIASGRNVDILSSLKGLGADETINLEQPDDKLTEAFVAATGQRGIDIVIDFLWGHPAEVLMNTFVPKELGFAKRRIRYIHIGQKAGAEATITGEMLRTSGLEIYGTGNIPHTALMEGVNQVWEWFKEGKLHIDIEEVPLSQIENAWHRNELQGKRLVMVP